MLPTTQISFTDHARERYVERFGTKPISYVITQIRHAHPVSDNMKRKLRATCIKHGEQFTKEGSATSYLISDDVIFVVKYDKPGKAVVVTVLNKPEDHNVDTR